MAKATQTKRKIVRRNKRRTIIKRRKKQYGTG